MYVIFIIVFLQKLCLYFMNTVELLQEFNFMLQVTVFVLVTGYKTL